MYDYKTERPSLFTESGIKTLMKIQANIRNATKHSGGVCTIGQVINVSGSSWTALAAVHYLQETGEIRVHEIEGWATQDGIIRVRNA